LERRAPDFVLPARSEENQLPDNQNGGPKSRRERQAMGLAIGIALGSGFGLLINNVALGIGVGLAIGIGLGSLYGSQRNKP
jgi:hypothetical protein